MQPPRDTVTTITQWPAEIPRHQRFVVGGTVNTVGGTAVHGVTVEVYVNETKEHGGTKIGTTVTRFGIFQASVEIPVGMELGSYQLLARAVPTTISMSRGATRTSLSFPPAGLS